MDMMEKNGVSFAGIALLTAEELRNRMQLGDMPAEDVARTEDRLIPDAVEAQETAAAAVQAALSG